MRSESVVVPAHRTERIDTRDQRLGQAHGHTDRPKQRHGGTERGTRERVKRGTGEDRNRHIRRGVFEACAGGEAVSWDRRIMSPFAIRRDGVSARRWGSGAALTEDGVAAMGYSMARCSYGIGRGGAALGAAGDGLDVCVGASLTLLAGMGAVARRAGCDWAAAIESLVCTLNGQDEERRGLTAFGAFALSTAATYCIHAGPGDHRDDLQPCHDQHIARLPIIRPAPKCLSCKGTPPLLLRPHVPGQAIPAATHPRSKDSARLPSPPTSRCSPGASRAWLWVVSLLLLLLLLLLPPPPPLPPQHPSTPKHPSPSPIPTSAPFCAASSHQQITPSLRLSPS